MFIPGRRWRSPKRSFIGGIVWRAGLTDDCFCFLFEGLLVNQEVPEPWEKLQGQACYTREHQRYRCLELVEIAAAQLRKLAASLAMIPLFCWGHESWGQKAAASEAES